MPESHTAGSHAASFRTVTASSRLTSGLRTEEDAQCTPTIIVQLVLSCLRLLNVKFSCVHIFILFIIYCNSHRSSCLLAVDISLRLRYIFSGESFPTFSVARLVLCQVRKWPFVTFSRPTHSLSQKLFLLVLVWTWLWQHQSQMTALSLFLIGTHF